MTSALGGCFGGFLFLVPELSLTANRIVRVSDALLSDVAAFAFPIQHFEHTTLSSLAAVLIQSSDAEVSDRIPIFCSHSVDSQHSRLMRGLRWVVPLSNSHHRLTAARLLCHQSSDRESSHLTFNRWLTAMLLFLLRGAEQASDATPVPSAITRN
jgi:hypothetical protein